MLNHASTRCHSRRSFMKPAVARTLLLLCLCLLPFAGTLPVLAQIGGGSIVGFVSDHSNAVIPGAQVSATDLDTGVATSATTNNQGYYEFPLLPAGHYTVE